MKLIPQSNPASDNQVSISPHVTAQLQSDYKTGKWKAYLDNVYATSATVTMVSAGYEISKDGSTWGSTLASVVNNDTLYVRLTTAAPNTTYTVRISSNQHSNLTYDGIACNILFGLDIRQADSAFYSDSGTSKVHHHDSVYSVCDTTTWGGMFSSGNRETQVWTYFIRCGHYPVPDNKSWLLKEATGSTTVAYQQSAQGERRQPSWCITTAPHITVPGNIRISGSARLSVPYFMSINKYRLPPVSPSVSLNANGVWSVGLSLSKSGDYVIAAFKATTKINGLACASSQYDMSSTYVGVFGGDTDQTLDDIATPGMPLDNVLVTPDVVDYVTAEALVAVRQKDYYVEDAISGTVSAKVADLAVTATSLRMVNPQ